MNQGIASIWHPIDIAILILYFLAMIGIGVAVMKKASKGLDSYFLAGNTLPWYVLGVSNASAHVRHHGHDVARLQPLRLRDEGHLAALALAHLQPGLPDGLPVGLDPPLERPHRRRVDHQPLRARAGAPS